MAGVLRNTSMTFKAKGQNWHKKARAKAGNIEPGLDLRQSSQSCLMIYIDTCCTESLHAIPSLLGTRGVKSPCLGQLLGRQRTGENLYLVKIQLQ
jgi:hypothetical protein